MGTLEEVVLCVVLLRSMACSIPIEHQRGNEALMLGHTPLPVALLIVAMVVSMLPIFKVPVGSGGKCYLECIGVGQGIGGETCRNRKQNVDEKGCE